MKDFTKIKHWADKRTGENYACCKCRRGEVTSLMKALMQAEPAWWGLSGNEIVQAIRKFKWERGKFTLLSIKKNWITREDGRDLLLQKADFQSMCAAYRQLDGLVTLNEVRQRMPDLNKLVQMYYKEDLYQARLLFPEIITDEVVQRGIKDDMRYLDAIAHTSIWKSGIGKLVRTLPNWKELLLVWRVLEE